MSIAEYISALKDANPQDAGLFCALLNTGIELMSLTDKDCARMFDVSRPSVTRWRNASTKPHVVVRKLVFAELKSRAKLLNKRSQRALSASGSRQVSETPLMAKRAAAGS